MSVTAERVCVRAQLLEWLDESDIADPHELAAAVADGADDEFVREFFASWLPHALRILAAGRRRKSTLVPPGSARQERIRERNGSYAWQVQRVEVDGTWKMLAECGVPDLKWIVGDRFTRAKALTGEAERYKRVLAVLAADGGSCLADVPADLVEGAWHD